MCLAQGPQHSDAGEARTRGLSVSSQALYHWATVLPTYRFVIFQGVVCGGDEMLTWWLYFMWKKSQMIKKVHFFYKTFNQIHPHLFTL